MKANPIYRSFAILLIISFGSLLEAQTSSEYIFLDDVTSEYANYLLASGRISPEYPLQQPYNYDDIYSADLSTKYSALFEEYWSNIYGGSTQFISGIQAGNTISNLLNTNSYRVESILGYTSKGLFALNRTRVYEAYRNDSLFAGDLSESDHWLYGRVHDAFIDFKTNHNHIFLGKMDHNWGPPGSPSLILSDNPYTYNKILYNYSNSKIRLSMLFAQLETSSGNVYYFEKDTSEYKANAAKYISGHRLDININPSLSLAFTEIAIYGGPNRQPELEFLNPMEFYYAVQRNDGAAMSGLWAVDISYRLLPKTLFYAQFLLDDIILNNDPGVDDRARFPDRLGFFLSSKAADYPLEGLLLDFSYTKLWNRTYQTYSFWENYHYRGKSLGYPHVSSEEFKIKMQYWGSFPHFISSHTTFGRYGAADVTDVFYLVKEDFPIAPVKFAVEQDFSYGWFNYTHLRMFFNYVFRYENLENVGATFNTISLDVDYTFIW